MRAPWRILAGSLIMFSYLMFSYYYFKGWFYSSIGTLLILFFSYLLWKKDFLSVTGLRIKPLQIPPVLFSAAIMFSVSWFLISKAGENKGIGISMTSFGNYYHDVFYILNEEIILGGVALYLLHKRLGLRKVLSSLVLAVFFSLVHYIFYRWVFNQPQPLAGMTLLCLFLVGIVRNNIILLTGHIGYSWALHFGWMAVMFGSFVYFTETGDGLTEPERFNTFLGSVLMTGLSALLAAISMLFLMKDKKDENT